MPVVSDSRAVTATPGGEERALLVPIASNTSLPAPSSTLKRPLAGNDEPARQKEHGRGGEGGAASIFCSDYRPGF